VAARQPKLVEEPFTLPHFEAWARDLVLDNGENWVLEPFQAAFLADFFAGAVESWLIVPEGNGKTTLLAGLSLYHCEFREVASVPVAASSREQAEIMYRQAEGFVYRSPRLRKIFKPQEGYRRVKCLLNGSRIQVFAADDRTGDGIVPTLCLVDELHRHRDLRLYRVWVGKLDKRKGQIVTISTAGEPGGEFEETRERIRQAGAATRDGCFGRFEADGLVMHEWAVPESGDVEDMAVVKAANPFSGKTVESLGKAFAAATMTLPHWRRFNCNLPTRGDDAAIQEVEWAAAETGDAIPEGEPVWVGLDVAWKWDTTAIVPLWMRDAEYRLLGPARILVPPRDGTSLDPGLVERALFEVHARNPIHTVVMDMSQAEQLAAWIQAELGAVVVDRGTGNADAVVDYASFMEALRMGWLKHTGDLGLKRHALNAVARVLPLGDPRFWRSSTTRQGGNRVDVHGAQERRVIDALTAAAMVHAIAAGQEVAEPMVAFG
jgi:phage terminase large subunit-like protein